MREKYSRSKYIEMGIMSPPLYSDLLLVRTVHLVTVSRHLWGLVPGIYLDS